VNLEALHLFGFGLNHDLILSRNHVSYGDPLPSYASSLAWEFVWLPFSAYFHHSLTLILKSPHYSKIYSNQNYILFCPFIISPTSSK